MISFILALAVQDFGVEWLDRVTRDREPAKGPLSVRPVESHFQLGALYVYDTNLYLQPDDRDADNVVIPFLRARMDYAAPRWDAAADVLVNYKRYLDNEDESDLEERAYGRIRYVGPKVQLEAAEIFRHESDAIDAQFSDRAERFLSTTSGRASVEVMPQLTIEANAILGLAFFRDEVLDDSDNWNLRADVGAAWRFMPTLEFVAHAGWLLIDYQDRGAPDADGYYARGGVRGDPLQTLSVVVLGGITRVRSDQVAATGDREEALTGDVTVNVRWEAMPRVVVWGDYKRQAGFAGPGDPFQIINRWVAAAEWQATPKLQVRGRLQHDHVDTALGIERTYWSLGPSIDYAFSPELHLDAGATWRRGDLGAPGDSVFDDVILHVGLVLTR